MAKKVYSSDLSCNFVHNSFKNTDLISEEWRPVEGYKDYFVSNLGRVKSTRRFKEGRILTPLFNNGYLSVILCKTNPDKTYTRTFKGVHVLVAQAFIENPDPEKYTQVNHINERKGDNNVTNLEWCTPTGNITYGTRSYQALKTILYRRNNYIKVTDNETSEIYLFEDTKTVQEVLGIHPTCVNLALRHMYGRGTDTIRQYRFEYELKGDIKVYAA